MLFSHMAKKKVKTPSITTSDRPRVRIAVGLVDNHPYLMKDFALSLVQVTMSFTAWASQFKAKEYTLDIIHSNLGYIDDMRNTVANQAVDGGYDYIFWMDSDMTFPGDCLARLLAYCERDGYEAACGLYTFKSNGFIPHLYPVLHEATGKFGRPKNFPLTQPFKVEGAGFGCLLMKTSVFKRVQRPYFTIKIEDGRMVQGEDLVFCRNAKMNMILDPNIRCGHMEIKNVGINDYLEYYKIKVEKDGWVRPTKSQNTKILAHLKKMFPND